MVLVSAGTAGVLVMMVMPAGAAGVMVMMIMPTGAAGVMVMMVVSAGAAIMVIVMLLVVLPLPGADDHLVFYGPSDLCQPGNQSVRIVGGEAQLPGGEGDGGLLHFRQGIEF